MMREREGPAAPRGLSRRGEPLRLRAARVEAPHTGSDHELLLARSAPLKPRSRWRTFPLSPRWNINQDMGLPLGRSLASDFDEAARSPRKVRAGQTRVWGLSRSVRGVRAVHHRFPEEGAKSRRERTPPRGKTIGPLKISYYL
jgi:hypothetical protein